jgi:hypothetical protein
MTGSTPALIITFVVVVVVLAAWIVAVLYADAHPEWQRRAASRRGIAGRAADPVALPRDESRPRGPPERAIGCGRAVPCSTCREAQGRLIPHAWALIDAEPPGWARTPGSMCGS